MTQPTLVTERINIAYDAMVSSSDLVQDIHDYKEDIEDWAKAQNSECDISLHHEPAPEYECTLYYLSVQIDERFSDCFRRSFCEL